MALKGAKRGGFLPQAVDPLQPTLLCLLRLNKYLIKASKHDISYVQRRQATLLSHAEIAACFNLRCCRRNAVGDGGADDVGGGDRGAAARREQGYE